MHEIFAQVRNVVCLLCCFCFTCPAWTQLILQLEKSGTLRTIRYAEGNLLTFRLKNDDKGWYERQILRIDVPAGKLVFPDVVVALDSIEAVMLEKKAVVSQLLGSALQVGGVNMVLFAAQDAIFQDRPFEWSVAGFGVLNVAAGTSLKKLFRFRTFRVSERKRLRLLDLNFSQPTQ